MNRLERRLAETEAALFSLLKDAPQWEPDRIRVASSSSVSLSTPKQKQTERMAEWDSLPLVSSLDCQNWFRSRATGPDEDHTMTDSMAVQPVHETVLPMSDQFVRLSSPNFSVAFTRQISPDFSAAFTRQISSDYLEPLLPARPPSQMLSILLTPMRQPSPEFSAQFVPARPASQELPEQFMPVQQLWRGLPLPFTPPRQTSPDSSEQSTSLEMTSSDGSDRLMPPRQASPDLNEIFPPLRLSSPDLSMFPDRQPSPDLSMFPQPRPWSDVSMFSQSRPSPDVSVFSQPRPSRARIPSKRRYMQTIPESPARPSPIRESTASGVQSYISALSHVWQNSSLNFIKAKKKETNLGGITRPYKRA